MSGKIDFAIPVQDKKFYIDKENIKILSAIADMEVNEDGDSINNVCITGPHGCGKSELVKQVAAIFKRPFYDVNCAFYREPNDFFGHKSLGNGEVNWIPSHFVKAVQTENTIVLLDELNRTSPAVLNAVFPLLDARRCTDFEQIGRIKVAKNVLFFSTMNKGVIYSGTQPPDAALLDRFPYTLELQYLEPDVEKKVLIEKTKIDPTIATKLVAVANDVRKKSAVGSNTEFKEAISTRMLIATARIIQKTGIINFDITILPKYSMVGGEQSQRAKMEALLEMHFGKSGTKIKTK